MEEAVSALSNNQALKPTILIVEDHFATRWAAAEYLRHRGCKVIEAVDSKEALGLAASGVAIDAVFSDINLDLGESGHELAQWFAKHRPSTPVVLTSGADHGSDVVASELRRFVRKPYDLAEVEQMLRSMLERS